jgi:hypothetical protein
MTLRDENREWEKLGLEDAGKSFKPLNLTVEQKIKHKKLLEQEWSYDDTCIFCGKTIHQAGGSKIISSRNIKMFMSDHFHGGGNPDLPYQSVKLDDDRFLVFKGQKTVWTKANIDKATSFVKQGFDVWWCQSKSCANRVCRICNSATQRAYGCDLVGGVHVSVHPVPAGCVDPDCEKHQSAW